MSRNKDLAAALTEKHNLSKQDAEKFVNSMFALISDSIEKEKVVKVKGLGTFKVVSVASRKSVDVNTGQPIVIEGRDKINFVPDANMRDEVNKPFSQFDTVVVNDGIDFSEIDRKFSIEENKEKTKDKLEEKTQVEELKAQEPVGDKRVEEQPAKEKLVEEQPAKEKLVEDEPIGDKPVEKEPVEEKPVEVKLAEEKIITEDPIQKSDVLQDLEKAEDSYKHFYKAEKSQHRALRYIVAACAAVVIICIVSAIYMFTQLQKRDNRIANLEAQVLSVVNKQNEKGKADKTKQLKSEVALTKIEPSKTKVEAPVKKNSQSVKSVKSAPKKNDRTKTLTESDNVRTESSVPDYDKDPRVRTGAYNIVGIDRSVTVKAGQSLASISRFYYGPGMECYVEAVNGGRTEFAVGDKINLPQLKHKKAKRENK